jgi:hypothetical protein
VEHEEANQEAHACRRKDRLSNRHRPRGRSRLDAFDQRALPLRRRQPRGWNRSQ